MRISITQYHINVGIPFICYSCAAALAIQDATGIKDVFVGSRWVHFPSGAVELPDAVCDWIARRDAGEESEPIEFELEVPCSN